MSLWTDKTTSEKLASFGLGHRKVTEEDCERFGHGPAAVAYRRVVFRKDTGEPLLCLNAWDSDLAANTANDCMATGTEPSNPNAAIMLEAARSVKKSEEQVA